MTGGIPGIVPRWEWRTFGDHFPDAEAAFGRLESTGIQESDEVYLLAGARNGVKVRDDLMDVKVLREVSSEGLERWEPVLKASFPMSADDVTTVLKAVDIAVPQLERETWTLDQFLADFGGDGKALRPVNVHKRRVRYKINGCTSEVTDVTADGHATKTIAIELEDGAAVVQAVRQVGLSGFVNTSYPRGLQALVEGRGDRYAVIDVGTNSVKFQVAERAADGSFRPIVDRAEITRLGEGLEQAGEIIPAALERTTVAIHDMVDEARREGAMAIAAVGTAGLRIASNSGDVVASVRKRTGVEIDVISGEDESRLAYLAAQSGLGVASGTVVVFDTGGGSSQFTFGEGARVDERFSVEVGAVRFTEQFGLDKAVSAEVVEQALDAISADLSRLDGRPKPDALVGMGGAVTNITAVKHGMTEYDPDVVQGTVLDVAELERQITMYRERDADARRQIPGLQPKRAEVILAGALVVRTVMRKLNQSSLTVSDRGLRHGVLAERFGDSGNPS
jgi:exopolyphosphatase/guanosine-5'-triphosphate,3'-diphosphate pyrophosphatase